MLTAHDVLVAAIANQLRMSPHAVTQAIATGETGPLLPGTSAHVAWVAYQVGKQAVARMLLDVQPNEKAIVALIEMGIDVDV